MVVYRYSSLVYRKYLPLLPATSSVCMNRVGLCCFWIQCGTVELYVLSVKLCANVFFVLADDPVNHGNSLFEIIIK
jgi:hypothetical protein